MLAYHFNSSWPVFSRLIEAPLYTCFATIIMSFIVESIESLKSDYNREGRKLEPAASITDQDTGNKYSRT